MIFRRDASPRPSVTPSGRRWASALALGCAASASPALSEPAPPPATPPAPSTKADSKPTTDAHKVDDVVVTAPADRTRVSIDRRSYEIARDLQGGTGSVADALRNVPALDVDLEGNVRMRGDGVTILVDGRPSTLFSGPGGGQALESIPADQFERVEVISNPTAALGPDGGGGAINLISKRALKPGTFGSVRIGADPFGRANASASLSHKSGKLSVSASAGLRHERRDGISDSTRESFDAGGTPSFRARTRTDQTSDSDASNARLGLDYRPVPSLHFTGALRGASTTSQSASVSRRRGVDLINAAPSETRRVGGVASDRSNVGFDGGIERSFAGDGHSLKLSLGAAATDIDRRQASTNFAVIPMGLTTFDRRETSQHQTARNLQLDYERPTPGSGKLKLGYELRLGTDDIATAGFNHGPSPHEPPDPGRSNRFRFERRIQGAYITYEKPFGDLTLLGGLRREVTDIDVDQVTSAVRAHAADADWYPTLHIGYRLNDANQVVGSFSRRIERPSAEAFNPFVVINGPYDQSRGNPDLKPEVTDQLELKYDYQGAQRSLELSLYDRRSRGGFGSVTTDLGGGVFLSTTTNLVGSRRTGVEFSASTPLSKTMSLTVSLDNAWVEVAPLPGLAWRGNSGMSTGGSAQLNWKMTPKDLLQLSASVDGAQIYDSSRTSGAATVNFGYRHKLDDHWSVLLVGQDINDGLETRSTFAAPGLRERSRSDPDRRTVFLSLSYTFGKTAKRDPDFDYGS